MGTKGYGIDSKRINDYALEIKNLHKNKIQIAIVIGGGNILEVYLDPVKELTEFRRIIWECLLQL